MSKKLIITKFEIAEQPCVVTAVSDGDRIVDLQIKKNTTTELVGNIYIGKVQKIVPGIAAAFIDIAPGVSCYYPLATNKDAPALKAGNELLVQVKTDALKTKVPAVTTNLNLSDQHLVLTSETKKLGMSGKLSAPEKVRLKEWLLPVMRDDCGIVVRTNARDCSQETLLQELERLYQRFDLIVKKGNTRTCYSLIEAAPPEYIRMLNDIDERDLEQVVTDDPDILASLSEYTEKTRFYQDALLPLYKLYALEVILENALKEKVWLKSGGFLVIQQTEAFIAIDVNSGKYQGKKNNDKVYRKINLEAAKEIAYQLRLRNLSGIVLIDFINMAQQDDQKELLRTLNGYLKADVVKAAVIDITALQIVEVTRKKVHKSLAEQYLEIKKTPK